MNWPTENEARIQTLQKDFQPEVRELIRLSVVELQLQLAIVQANRTPAQQFEYWKKGRSFVNGQWVISNPKRPETVTQAKTVWETPHGWGCAVDPVFLVNGQPSWDEHLPWQKLGLIGERLGLTWGGRFPHPDEDHFELKDWRRYRPLTAS